MRLPRSLLALSAFACLLTGCGAQGTPERGATAGGAPELGTVAWLRDHDAGAARARKETKPVFLLFQEVPG